MSMSSYASYLIWHDARAGMAHFCMLQVVCTQGERLDTQKNICLLHSNCDLQEWARLIAKGEVPNPMSSRDGKLLKLVSPSQRLLQPELEAHLQHALRHHLQEEAGCLLSIAWSKGDPF